MRFGCFRWPGGKSLVFGFSNWQIKRGSDGDGWDWMKLGTTEAFEKFEVQMGGRGFTLAVTECFFCICYWQYLSCFNLIQNEKHIQLLYSKKQLQGILSNWFFRLNFKVQLQAATEETGTVVSARGVFCCEAVTDGIRTQGCEARASRLSRLFQAAFKWSLSSDHCRIGVAAAVGSWTTINYLLLWLSVYPMFDPLSLYCVESE